MSFARHSSALRLFPQPLGYRPGRQFLRPISTLASNPHIYVFPENDGSDSHILTLLPTAPPARNLAIGTTVAVPPTPTSFSQNPRFVDILHEVFRKHTHNDPEVNASANIYASAGGSPVNSARRRGGFAVERAGSGAGGANVQGGMGGGGVGGWVHVCDKRNPAPVGRVGDPGDIVGSVMVDANGRVVEGGYQRCGTYRVVTNDGILGLSDYLREKLVERLREMEKRS